MEFNYTPTKGHKLTWIFNGDNRLQVADIVARLNQKDKFIAKIEKIMREQNRLLEEAMARVAQQCEESL